VGRQPRNVTASWSLAHLNCREYRRAWVFPIWGNSSKIPPVKMTVFIAGLALCLIMPSNCLGGKMDDYNQARKQAIERSDIFTDPLQLRATIHVHGFKTSNGSYEYLRISKDNSVLRIQYPDYNIVVTRKEGNTYVVSSQPIEPLPATHIRELISGAQHIFINPPISQVATSKENGVDTKCYRTDPPEYRRNFFYEACFDLQTGSLMSLTWLSNSETHHFEYLGFMEDGGKRYPGIMRFYKNGKLMSEVTVDSLSHLPLNPRDHAFDLAPGAIEQAECSKFERAEPEYQKDYFLLRSDSKAEDQHVVLAGRLDEKGRAGDVLIQQPGTELADNLALRAVKEIHFQAGKVRSQGRSLALSSVHLVCSGVPYGWLRFFSLATTSSPNPSPFSPPTPMLLLPTPPAHLCTHGSRSLRALPAWPASSLLLAE
jgi:hypothetical protein